MYKVLGLLKHTRILIKDGSDELLGVQNAELLFSTQMLAHFSQKICIIIDIKCKNFC